MWEFLRGIFPLGLVFVSLGPGSLSCGKAMCSGAAIIAPKITVTDSITGQSICDATVVAVRDGSNPDAAVPLEFYVPPSEAATACVWDGPAPVANGTVTLIVSRAGYRTATARATWHLVSCDSSGPVPQSESVNVRLTPG